MDSNFFYLLLNSTILAAEIFKKVHNVYAMLFFSDQRITQDVEKFCNNLGTQILPKLILWPFIVGYYTYKTYAT